MEIGHSFEHDTGDPPCAGAPARRTAAPPAPPAVTPDASSRAARFDARTPLQLGWGGPEYVAANDLSDAGWLEVVVRTSIGGVQFAGFLWICWRLVIRRLWDRGYDPPQTVRGTGAKAVFGAPQLDPV